MARLAWFSPMPPARSGVAVNSADLIPILRQEHEIDVFVDEPIARAARRTAQPEWVVRSAHDFVWLQQLAPYDLCVYQMGNSSAHDFLWPYLFKFPGLAILHDGHLHHARAAGLLRQNRPHDYRDEFAWAHPFAQADAAELAVAGFDSFLYYSWPMTRLVLQASRLAAVHSPILARRLAEEVPGAIIESIRLGHGSIVEGGSAAAARQRIRRRHAIHPDAVVFGLFGGAAPEKRVPQVLDALSSVLRVQPNARLMIAGANAPHYDLLADVRRRQFEPPLVITGYLDDEELTDHLVSCDVSLNLRWPSAREMSGPWLRAIAAGLPTITVDLWHMADVPSLDPRTWTVNHAAARDADAPAAVTVAIDVLDEAHSLSLAMRRLASDADLRARLGRAAREYWIHHHSHAAMLDDYRRVVARAIGTPDPAPPLPAHLRPAGDEHLRTLLEPFGIDQDAWSRI